MNCHPCLKSKVLGFSTELVLWGEDDRTPKALVNLPLPPLALKGPRESSEILKCLVSQGSALRSTPGCSAALGDFPKREYLSDLPMIGNRPQAEVRRLVNFDEIKVIWPLRGWVGGTFFTDEYQHEP